MTTEAAKIIFAGKNELLNGNLNTKRYG